MKKSNILRFVVFPIVVALLLAGIAVSAVFMLLKADQREFEDRSTVMAQYAKDTALLVDKNMDYAELEADLGEQALLAATDLHNVNDLYAVLAETNTATKTASYMLAFSNDGKYYYASEEKQGTGTLPANFDVSAITGKQSVISDIAADVPCVMMVKALSSPVIVGDSITITHVSAAMNLSSLQEAFPDTDFYNNSAIYLTDENGANLFHDPSQYYNDVYVENVLDALATRNFIEGDVDDLKVAIENGTATEMTFEREDGTWYVSYYPTEDAEVSLLLFAPETAITPANESYYTEMVILIIAFVLCVLLLGGILFAVEYKIRLNRQKRALPTGSGNNNPTQKLVKPIVDDGMSNNITNFNGEMIDRNDYLSEITNDMRAPVNGIIGITNNALQNRNDAQLLEDCLFKINGTSNRLLSLVNDVIDISRLNSGSAVLVKNAFDMRSLIDNCAAIVGGRLLLKKVMFVCEFGDFTSPRLYGDEMRLRQILLCLLKSAGAEADEIHTVNFIVNQSNQSEGQARFYFDIQVALNDELNPQVTIGGHEKSAADDTTESAGISTSVAKRYIALMGGDIIHFDDGQNARYTFELPFNVEAWNGDEIQPCDQLSSNTEKPA